MIKVGHAPTTFFSALSRSRGSGAGMIRPLGARRDVAVDAMFSVGCFGVCMGRRCVK
jgi:hypothetical protein